MAVENPYIKYRSVVRGWKQAAAALDGVRIAEIAALDTRRVIQELSGLIDHAIETVPPAKESGLVIQQRLLDIVRQNGLGILVSD